MWPAGVVTKIRAGYSANLVPRGDKGPLLAHPLDGISWGCGLPSSPWTADLATRRLPSWTRQARGRDAAGNRRGRCARVGPWPSRLPRRHPPGRRTVQLPAARWATGRVEFPTVAHHQRHIARSNLNSALRLAHAGRCPLLCRNAVLTAAVLNVRYGSKAASAPFPKADLPSACYGGLADVAC